MNMAFATINPFSFPEVLEEILMTPLSTNPHISIGLNSPTLDFLENFDKFLDATVSSNITSSAVLGKSIPYVRLDDTNGATSTKYKSITIPYKDGKRKEVHLVYNIVHGKADNDTVIHYPPMVFDVLKDELVILTHALLGEMVTITNNDIIHDVKKLEKGGFFGVVIINEPIFSILDRLYLDLKKIYNFLYFDGVDKSDEQTHIFRLYSIMTAIYNISNKIANDLNISTKSYDDQDIYILDMAINSQYSKIGRAAPSKYIDGKKLKTYIEKRDDSIVSEVLARPKYMEEAALIMSLIDA